jgi:uncharacterized protein
MRKVFVDTGGFLGLLVAEDASHGEARELFERADAERWELVTTNAVVIETYSVLLARARDTRRGTMTFLDLIAADPYRLEHIRKRDEDRSIALVRGHTDKTYSLCDALSFVVMERLGLNRTRVVANGQRDHLRTAFIGLGNKA